MRNVVLVSCAFFFIFFGFGTAQQYLVILFSELGHGSLALTSLLLLYSAFLLTGIIVPKFVPILGGLKSSLILGACTYVFFSVAVALDIVPLLLFASVVIGIGAGFLWVTSGKIITDSSEAHAVGQNLSLQQIGMYSGNILGVWIGGFLVQTLSLQNMFALLAFVTFLGTVLLFFVLPVREDVQTRPFKPYYLFAPHMLMLLPLIFGAYYLQAQVFTAMNLAIVGLVGIGFIPLIISVLKVSNIIGSFSSGTLSGWYSKSGLLITLVAIALCGIVVFTLFSTLSSLLLGAILLGFSMAAIYPVALAWLKEKLPGDEYLYALSTFHVYTNIAVLGAIGVNLYLPAQTSFIPGALALLLAIPGIIMFQKFRPLV